MPVNVLPGYGATLGVDAAGGSSFTTLAAIDMEGFSLEGTERTMVETTLLADQWKTYKTGDIEPGTCSFNIAYDAADTVTTQTLVDLLTQSTPTPTWQITYPVVSSSVAAETETFSAHLQGMGRSVAKDSMITCPVTLKLTGNPGFSGSA